MLNFTVGPVMSYTEVRAVAGEQTPYFRTREFSHIMLENERLILNYLNAPPNSRCVFLTASGTGAMESCVMSILSAKDRVLVINGGSFGQRFVDLCKLHQIKYHEISCEFGHQLEIERLEEKAKSGYTALLVNMNETSSGVLYDMKSISTFCKENEMLLIIDAISSFIADSIDMNQLGAAAIMIGSQKALAVQPGVSAIALSGSAIERIKSNPEKCMYLSLKEALKNMERGQTPYTPAVTILLQINKRLKMIEKNGGILSETRIINERARYFREKIKEYPFDFVVSDDKDRSNAVTAICSQNHKADFIFNQLKNKYGIWVCPNGGIYKTDVFRVGHIGDLKLNDYDQLLDAIKDLIFGIGVETEDKNKRRIYSEKINLCGDNIRDFYDKRANKFRGGEKNKFTTVLLGDDRPDYAVSWDLFEKNFILPYLNIGSSTKVLDIGCGIGRWAETIFPLCDEYVGTDFSSGMIATALENFKDVSNTKFINCSFQDLFADDAVNIKKYDAVIITGVSMYINDEDLRKCYGQLVTLLNDNAVIYIEESVGVKQRLTLNHIWSEHLDANYDAIYRTREEYLELMTPLILETEIIKEDYFNELDKKDMSETSHWFIVLKKK